MLTIFASSCLFDILYLGLIVGFGEVLLLIINTRITFNFVLAIKGLTHRCVHTYVHLRFHFDFPTSLIAWPFTVFSSSVSRTRGNAASSQIDISQITRIRYHTFVIQGLSVSVRCHFAAEMTILEIPYFLYFSSSHSYPVDPSFFPSPTRFELICPSPT
ncbi:hypothetical protein BZA70DRAFT_95563 [Myxozyma melibiosi]|uniref:Uncharacterized protein n=1 Tax=Myxozyma melibiosi TaxID=54550 RepID=A0ABR1EZ27_9ASCO